MSARRTCAYCHASRGDDARALVAVARRAGVELLRGATHLHAMCRTLVQQAMRAREAVRHA